MKTKWLEGNDLTIKLKDNFLAFHSNYEDFFEYGFKILLKFFLDENLSLFTLSS